MRLRHWYTLALLLLAAAAPDASAQVGLRETFGPGRSGPVGGLAAGNELQRKTVDQQAFPLARCNDNSPAIFYFRPASRRQDADKWLIHLQGGGSCASGLSCSERWFSVHTNFGAKNMTSVGFPAGTSDPGIFEREGRQNPFETYNQVFVHYCSSDTWGGTKENVVMTGIDFGPSFQNQGLPCAQQYTISFLGRRIFEGVVETLRRNGVPPLVFLNPDGAPQVMPDLDDARAVVLSGGSAGGYGVANNLDHLRDTLPARARVVGLSDSAFRPSKDGMDLSQTRLCENKSLCTVEAQNQWDYAEGPFAVWGLRDGSDSSCLTYHAGDPHMCADNRHILTDHVTTPYFVRMDQLDPGAIEDFQKDNIFIAGTPDPDPGTPEHEPLSEQEFAEATRAGVLALASVRRTAHESANIQVTPGAFSPAYRQHDELRSNSGVYGTAVRWRRGIPVPMFSVFQAWLAGNSPTILAATGEADSVCPSQ